MLGGLTCQVRGLAEACAKSAVPSAVRRSGEAGGRVAACVSTRMGGLARYHPGAKVALDLTERLLCTPRLLKLPVKCSAAPPQAFLHPDAHQEGGLACTNQKLLEQQRLAILDLVRPHPMHLQLREGSTEPALLAVPQLTAARAEARSNKVPRVSWLHVRRLLPRAVSGQRRPSLGCLQLSVYGCKLGCSGQGQL